MFRLVICSPYHTSCTNPRSIRINNLISEIENQFDYLFITNPSNKEFTSNSFCKFHGTKISQQKGNKIASSYLTKLLKKFVWPDLFIFNSLYHTFLYFNKYKRKGDLLLSISNPISIHIIGLISKMLYRNSVVWIADIGDLFSQQDVTIFRSVTRLYEMLIVKKADRIIINSQGLFNILTNRYPNYKAKFLIITNGSSIRFNNVKSDHQSNINYIGNSYLPIRSGLEELEILKAIQKKFIKRDFNVNINLYGRQNNELISAYSSPCIQFHPFLEQDKLLNIYSQTNILFSLANKNYNTMPSKLEEYILSGLPIIYFCYSSEDCGIEFLKMSNNTFIYVLGIDKLDELYNFVIEHYSDGIKAWTNSNRLGISWFKLLEDLNI